MRSKSFRDHNAVLRGLKTLLDEASFIHSQWFGSEPEPEDRYTLLTGYCDSIWRYVIDFYFDASGSRFLPYVPDSFGEDIFDVPDELLIPIDHLFRFFHIYFPHARNDLTPNELQDLIAFGNFITLAASRLSVDFGFSISYTLKRSDRLNENDKHTACLSETEMMALAIMSKETYKKEKQLQQIEQSKTASKPYLQFPEFSYNQNKLTKDLIEDLQQLSTGSIATGIRHFVRLPEALRWLSTKQNYSPGRILWQRGSMSLPAYWDGAWLASKIPEQHTVWLKGPAAHLFPDALRQRLEKNKAKLSLYQFYWLDRLLWEHSSGEAATAQSYAPFSFFSAT